MLLLAVVPQVHAGGRDELRGLALQLCGVAGVAAGSRAVLQATAVLQVQAVLQGEVAPRTGGGGVCCR